MSTFLADCFSLLPVKGCDQRFHVSKRRKNNFVLQPLYSQIECVNAGWTLAYRLIESVLFPVAVWGYPWCSEKVKLHPVNIISSQGGNSVNRKRWHYIACHWRQRTVMSDKLNFLKSYFIISERTVRIRPTPVWESAASRLSDWWTPFLFLFSLPKSNTLYILPMYSYRGVLKTNKVIYQVNPRDFYKMTFFFPAD